MVSLCGGSVHQDSWGKQGRRVLSTPPPNTLLGPDPTDAILALRRCDANNNNSAQKWSLDEDTGRLWTTALSNLPQQASSAANGGGGGGTGVVKWSVGGATIPWGRPAGLVAMTLPMHTMRLKTVGHRMYASKSWAGMRMVAASVLGCHHLQHVRCRNLEGWRERDAA